MVRYDLYNGTRDTTWSAVKYTGHSINSYGAFLIDQKSSVLTLLDGSNSLYCFNLTIAVFLVQLTIPEFAKI